MAGRILIVDAVATNRIILKVKLASAFYQVSQAGSAAAALRIARANPPDLVLLDESPDDAGGARTCAALRAIPALADTPVLVLSIGADPDARMRAIAAGADDVLIKPLDEDLLLALIRNVLRARALRREFRTESDTAAAMGLAEPRAAGFEGMGRIALISGGDAAQADWGPLIAALGPHRCGRYERRTALLQLSGHDPPDVVLIDPGDTPGEKVLRLLSDLQTLAGTRRAATLLIAGPDAATTGVAALDMGLADLIPAAAPPAERAMRMVRQLRRKQAADRSRAALLDGARLSVIDPLTGLFNRRFALRRIEEVAARADASGAHFAALVLDIDRFKRINDFHGHTAGDAALQVVAGRMRAVVRPADLLARIGGEEFLVVLPDTDLPSARALAERLRLEIGGRPFALPGGHGEIAVTLSIGLALGGPPDRPGTSARLAIDRADRALLAAKAHGRNQVNVSRTAA